jgi:hypothetical protein
MSVGRQDQPAKVNGRSHGTYGSVDPPSAPLARLGHAAEHAGRDYPHSDSTWHQAPEKLWVFMMKGLLGEDIHKITGRNTTRYFSYDPFKHIPKERRTVGALRLQAEDVDLTPRVCGGTQPSDYSRGYITIGDIMKPLAQAISTPFESGSAG